MLLNKRLDGVQSELMSQVSGDELIALTAGISRETRLSGSEEELRAFQWAKEQLESWGMSPRLLFHDGYVSWPISADLQVTGLGGVACITHAMAASTQGLSAELVYVGNGMAADYAAKDVRGKAVLIDGLAAPGRVRLAAAQGTVAQIFIVDERFREMIVSPIWGNPTLEQLKEMPSTPVVSVRYTDGQRLKQALAERRLSIQLKTEVDTRWRKLPILEVEIPGQQEDSFVLLSGHIDSWHLGAMDNGSANATMLMVTRLLHQQRQHLKRGLRVCFWSGHSHGRYCGSAWYADEFWADLSTRCVAHVNVDSLGGRGGTVLTEAFAMAETKDLGYAILKAETGDDFRGTRPNRSGDQSFLGMGVPSLLMNLSEPPADPNDLTAMVLTGGSAGIYPWWHTVDDKLENIDPGLLARDCRIYLGVVFRLCAERILPFNCQAAAEEYRSILMNYANIAGSSFSLSVALEKAERAVAEAERVGALAESLRQSDSEGSAAAPSAEAVADLNRKLSGLSRALIPTNYTRAGQFGQDYALPPGILPVLARIHELAKVEPESDTARHLRVDLARGRNQVLAALDLALAALK